MDLSSTFYRIPVGTKNVSRKQNTTIRVIVKYNFSLYYQNVRQNRLTYKRLTITQKCLKPFCE